MLSVLVAAVKSTKNVTGRMIKLYTKKPNKTTLTGLLSEQRFFIKCLASLWESTKREKQGAKIKRTKNPSTTEVFFGLKASTTAYRITPRVVL